VLGLHDVQQGGVNLATKFTWTIWWAAIIFTFFLAGRAWCLACRFGARNEWASRRWLVEESYLAVALVGLTLVVTAQMLVAWPAFVSWLAGWLPAAVRANLKPVTYLGLVESALFLGVTLVAGPALVAGGGVLAQTLAGGGPGLRRTFAIFGYMFVPVGLALHLAHNVAHLLLEGGGIVPAVQRAVAVYTPWSIGQPDWQGGPLASAGVVWLLQMAILFAFFVLSLQAGHRLALRAFPDPRAAGRAFVPLAVLSALFTVAGIVLLNLPMGMRHGM
jgi:hypothetical protein